MTQRFQTKRVGRTVMQSGIPTSTPSDRAPSASGLMLRGVVTATYATDEDTSPAWRSEQAPLGIFCDVLCYSTKANLRWLKLPGVPVIQDRGAMHSGRIWKPRATTIDVSGVQLEKDAGGNPGNWDGDHVLVGFMDDSLNAPIILGGVPHPTVDKGNGERDIGHRRRLKLEDGDPDFLRHHASYHGISTDGDHWVDTTRANDGSVNPDGTEPDPPTDGKGTQYRALPKDAAHLVELLNMSDPENEFAQVRSELVQGGRYLDTVDDAEAELIHEELTKDGHKIALEVDKVLQELTQTGFYREIKDAVVQEITASGFILELGGGATLDVTGSGAAAVLTLGDGGKHAVIAETWQTFWDTVVKPLFTAFDVHVHPTGVGPSGPPIPVVALPVYPSAATSSKVEFPDL